MRLPKAFDFNNFIIFIGFGTMCYGMWVQWGFYSLIIGGAALFLLGVFLDILSVKINKK